MSGLKQAVVNRIGDGPPAQVWTPVGFLDLGTDTRRRTIHLDNLTIEFKQTAPSKLYWSGPNRE